MRNRKQNIFVLHNNDIVYYDDGYISRQSVDMSSE